MEIQLLSVGTRTPGWVRDGFAEYAKRLPAECRLRLVEIPLGRRGKGADLKRALREEGERMLQAIPAGSRVVALDPEGSQWSTEQLAQQLSRWLGEGVALALLVGGPDGLAEPCRQRADQLWSLSALTFPHALVRVLVAEQFYRACSILRRHPYHRG